MRITRFEKPVSETLFPGKPSPSTASRTRLVPRLCALFLFSFVAILAPAQHPNPAPDYKTIVVFGDSLSDVGNFADLTQAKYGVRIPGPYADYTNGRFTDGADTLPAAQNYFGVWVEQLAATFPSKPKIKPSRNGGTDYAYGFAFTGKGTSVYTFGLSNSLSIKVDNIGLQISDYLATHPKITDKTLFIVWGGANDLLSATSEDAVIDAGINQTLNIQRLIDAGATQFIIPNLPPLGLVPRLNTSPATSVPATEAAQIYNEVLAGGIAVLRELHQRKALNLLQLDVFTLFNQIVAAPADFDLVNVTQSAQGQDVDPDTWLFWDSLHPTTRGHNLLALAAGQLLAPNTCTAAAPNQKSPSASPAVCVDASRSLTPAPR